MVDSSGGGSGLSHGGIAGVAVGGAVFVVCLLCVVLLLARGQCSGGKAGKAAAATPTRSADLVVHKAATESSKSSMPSSDPSGDTVADAHTRTTAARGSDGVVGGPVEVSEVEMQAVQV